MNLEVNVRSYIDTEKLFPKGSSILIGVSGGADSTALLCLLSEFRYAMGLRITVAHYNHGLRRSALRDERFVQDLCSRYGVRCIVGRRTRAVPKTGSIEDHAREERYAFFATALQKAKADMLAVAHTEDDLAETVLMRMLRGSGLDGIRAILPKRILNGIVVVRPLLSTSRTQVEAFLAARKQRFVTDPTNASMDMFRNLIRCQVIPLIEKIVGKNVRGQLARLAATAAQDYDWLEREAGCLFKKRIRGNDGLDVSGWAEIHPAMRYMLLRLTVARVKKDFKALSLQHIEELDHHLMAGAQSFCVILPEGFLAHRPMGQKYLRFSRAMARRNKN